MAGVSVRGLRQGAGATAAVALVLLLASSIGGLEPREASAVPSGAVKDPDGAVVALARVPEPKQTPPPTEDPSSVPSADPTQRPAADELATEEVTIEAAETVTRFLREYDEALQGESADPQSSQVAVGAALGELEAVAADYAEQGFVQEGTVKVLAVEVTELAGQGADAIALVDVCVDASDVDVLDQAGNSLADFLFRPGHPVVETFELGYIDGAWRIVTRHFTEEVIACSA